MAAARPTSRRNDRGPKPARRSAAKSKSQSKKGGRGGRRPGAGRPRKPEPVAKPPAPPRPLAGTEVDGRKVASLSRLGVVKDTIITALRVPREYLQRVDFVAAFDDEIAFGAARREIDLLRERRDLATGRSAFGKVSATLAGMRNMGQNWDRVDKDRGGPKLADQQGAIAEADKILAKFRPGKR